MAELIGAPLHKLLDSIWTEWHHSHTIFGYPERKLFRGFPDCDFTVTFHDKKAATPLGPASGPHTQLAQNIVLAFLGGARIMELKTVQIKDQLQIPRPCIDVRNIGFNVEWSQELRLEDSLQEYLKAWILIHALQEWEILGVPKGHPFYQVIFDASVGYDYAGITSPAMQAWLRRIHYAQEDIIQLLDALPPRWKALKKLDVPTEVVTSVTLSTFHGCPRDEIEDIVKHLIAEHHFHVMIKLNPTILGYQRVKEILHHHLGYTHIQLDEEAFRADLQLEDALAMMQRLRDFARQHNRNVGAKFTNTLVVKNHDNIFQEPVMYLSGAPLHVIALEAMMIFRQNLGAGFPVSFSAGIHQKNFSQAVQMNMTPITVCTDLLKTGGYTRLFGYLKALREEMQKRGVSTISDYILASCTDSASSVEEAGWRNVQRIVPNLHKDKQYHYSTNRKTPPQLPRQLQLLDCISCNKCLPVCPNAANFTIPTQPGEWPIHEVVFQNNSWQVRGTVRKFRIEKPFQIANLADWCNECGNCDTYCPEQGAPYKIKPRFFSSLHSYKKFRNYDGFFLKDTNTLIGRRQGKEYLLQFRPRQNHFVFQTEDWQIIFDENDTPISISHTNGENGSLLLDTFYLWKTIWKGIREAKHHYAAIILAPEDSF